MNVLLQKGNSNAIALSIVAAGALIAGALFLALNSSASSLGVGTESAGLEPTDAPSALRPVSESDHILGDPDARVSIIEFSDFECPFCAQLHPTLEQVVEANDDVNWVYRHFPLSSIHARAFAASHASECAAELGGNDAFWAYSKGLFDNQNRLGTELYEELALEHGIVLGEFQACMESNRHADRIDADFNEAQRTGGRGTPYAIAINANGEGLPFSGALPFATIEQVVEALR